MEADKHLLVIITLSSLLFFNSADAICVPRNITHASRTPPPVAPHHDHVSSPPPKSPAAPPRHVLSPPPVSPPPTQKPKPSPPPYHSEPPKPEPSDPTAPSPLIPPLLPSIKIDPAIKKICTSTDNPDICLSSIAPYLSGKVDLVSVLEMEVKACNHGAQIALAVATRIAKDPSTPPRTASNIDACKDTYSDAMDNLQSAIDAIPARDVGTINSMLSAALTDFGTCEDGFMELPGVFSPMVAYDEVLGKLASNCLAIASLIH